MHTNIYSEINIWPALFRSTKVEREHQKYWRGAPFRERKETSWDGGAEGAGPQYLVQFSVGWPIVLGRTTSFWLGRAPLCGHWNKEYLKNLKFPSDQTSSVNAHTTGSYNRTGMRALSVATQTTPSMSLIKTDLHFRSLTFHNSS